jgi:DNA repair protein RecN (Recombination protein N)
MLTRLIIHDVVLIEKLTLEFASGLNVLTGETGAGKSILLDALGLALGDRSDAGLVRQGAPQASVTAEFELQSSNHPIFELAAEQGLSVGNPLILRRLIGKDGKSRAFIDDQPISINLLRQFGATLLEIHGQFETHGLLNPATHRGLLDDSGALGDLRQKVNATFRDWKDADNALTTARLEQSRAEAEEHFLRDAVAELDELSPEVNEADQLAERRTQLQHREKILDALQTVEQSLSGDRGATAALAQAGKAVARIADKAKGLEELLATIDRAAHETSEATRLAERALADLDAQPDALQRIEERLFALRAVARKHNVGVEGLPDVRRDMATKLALLTDKGDRLKTLAKQVEAARHAYKQHAEQLSAKRTKTAAQLEQAITSELPPLKFERAQFIVEVAPLPEDQWMADGIDRVSFLATINPGTAPGSLAKIASGGELARFMLALKVVLVESNPVPTLVFDEVDAGIGGATASAVGERLARLGEHLQLLVVTHSPQVAARGAHHLQVSKRTLAKQAITEVKLLDNAERREEIARMLAGTHVTDAAREAADSLMEAGQVATTAPAKQKAQR